MPLYWGYRKLELILPFKLELKNARAAYFLFIFLGYVFLEFARGYAIMVLVIDYLAFDFDLLIGILIWLVGISWPPFVPKSYRSAPWLVLSGVYFYLFPTFIFILPCILIGLYLLGMKASLRYLTLGSAFLLIGIFDGSNGLFILLYGLLLVFSYLRNVVGLERFQYS
ncbi:MAG: hypothetical protein VW397_04180 [Candidatus Margulisiibacteriota bacterium]